MIGSAKDFLNKILLKIKNIIKKIIAEKKLIIKNSIPKNVYLYEKYFRF